MDDLRLTSGTNWGPRLLRGISFQLMALLSLALLPIGAIAVSLSLHAAREAQWSEDVGILAQTKEIASDRLDQMSSGAKGGKRLGDLAPAGPMMPPPPIAKAGDGPVPGEVVVLSASGTVLASTGELDSIKGRLPEMATVVDLLNGPDGVYDGTDTTGKPARFAKVTLVSGAIAAIGVLPPDSTNTWTNGIVFRALFLPTLIWVVSLLAAFFAARLLVISPILSLQREMRRFALGQRNPPMVLPWGAALEIEEVTNTFSKLQLIVARNEAVLAATAEGKLLLLREVHHRIKNNLQMISSIISIQRRKTSNGDARLLLRSLQDRVLSIAAVDQSLYLNGDGSAVRADILIAAIADRLIGVSLEPGHGVKIMTEYDPVVLHADQIGPLSLLANESVTNALKYVGKTVGGRAFVDIRLKWQDSLVAFSVSNSVGPDWRGHDETPESTGLGTPLIRAFCDQLAADCQSGRNLSDQTFTLSVQFRPSELTNRDPAFVIAL